MRDRTFALGAVGLLALGLAAPKLAQNAYLFYAGYVLLQFVVIATAWNILGGYAGYVNFGAAAFFGAGVYAAAFLFKAFAAPLLLQIVFAALIGGLVGVGMGWLTLRIQGVYFAIGTIALTIMIETVVVNWDYLGGARGMPVLPPPPPAWFGGQTQFLFFAMLALAIGSVALARSIERSWIGRGFKAIKADEAAAECAGVPTLRLKLLACAASGSLLAVAGAPYPFYANFIEPAGAFGLFYALNALAMPLIGGTRSWPGPVIGALLLGGVQQIATVTISSELNILFVGLALVVFVAAAPDGLLGLLGRLPARARRP